jgi:hypothetical protein
LPVPKFASFSVLADAGELLDQLENDVPIKCRDGSHH